MCCRGFITFEYAADYSQIFLVEEPNETVQRLFPHNSIIVFSYYYLESSVKYWLKVSTILDFTYYSRGSYEIFYTLPQVTPHPSRILQVSRHHYKTVHILPHIAVKEATSSLLVMI